MTLVNFDLQKCANAETGQIKPITFDIDPGSGTDDSGLEAENRRNGNNIGSSEP